MTEGQAQWIVPIHGAKTLPVVEVLTGRGVIFGKSGSGKSNSAGVIAEELLDNDYSLLIVDPEGEYYGLKEQYEVLHVGNGDICDVQVGPEHGPRLAEIALKRNMPVILDVSDYLDADVASSLIENTVEALFHQEKDIRKPFLLMVEEIQEYVPQQGGSDDLSELLERVAKRGRKRGLGMLGMSQRPSSVDKDFITQCDWMVWHRLTWKNDIDVVRDILGSEIANQVEDLDTGEGFLMTDWDESVERVQFKRKRTFDAGSTPGLENYERQEQKAVSTEFVTELERGSSPGVVTGEDVETLSDDERASLNERVESIQENEQVESIQENEQAESIQENEQVESIEEEQPDVLTDEDAGGSEIDAESLDEDELRDKIRSLQRTNQQLAHEVTESRSVVDVESRSSTPGNKRSPTNQKRVAERAADQPAPRRPVPPEPPVQRDGVAGNLVELVALFGYLMRSLVYRCKMLLYRTRS